MKKKIRLTVKELIGCLCRVLKTVSVPLVVVAFIDILSGFHLTGLVKGLFTVSPLYLLVLTILTLASFFLIIKSSVFMIGFIASDIEHSSVFILENKAKFRKTRLGRTVFSVNKSCQSLYVYANWCFKLIKRFSWLVLVYFTVAMTVVAPVVSNAATISENASSFRESLSTNIGNLTASDYSINILTVLWGSVLTDTRQDPLSLTRITDLFSDATSDSSSASTSTASTYLESASDGLQISWFDTLVLPSSLLSETVTTSSLTPDSPMGWLLCILGFMFIGMVFIAATYRMLATMTINFTDLQDNSSQVIKTVLMQFSSAVTSMVLTVPISKGYNILCLLLITLQVIGIAIANYFVLGLFSSVIVAGANPLQSPSQAVSIYRMVSAKTVCASARAASSGGVGQLSDISSLYSVTAQGEYSYLLTFRGCGSITIEGSETADTVDYVATLFSDLASSTKSVADQYDDMKLSDDEKTTLKEYVQEQYIAALKVMVTSISTIYVAALDDDIDVYSLIEACKQHENNVSNQRSDMTDDEKTIADAKDDIISQCNTGSTTSLAYQTEQVQLTFAQTYRKIYAYVLAKAQGTNTTDNSSDLKSVKKTADTFKNQLDIDDPSTYGMYTAGWLLYPFYSAVNVVHSQQIANLLNFSVSQTGGFEDEANLSFYESAKQWVYKKLRYMNIMDPETTRSDYADIDAAEAQALIEVINAQAAKNLSTGDWTEITEAWSGESEDDMGLADMLAMPPEAQAPGISNSTMNWVGLKLAKMLIPENGNVIPTLSNVGHWILDIDYILGGFSAYLKPKKKSLLKEVADDVVSVGKFAALAFIDPPLAAAQIAVKGVMAAVKPILQQIAFILSYARIIGFMLAYALPMIPAYFMFLSFMKWFAQIIKASVITTVVPVKLFNGEGNDLFGKASAEVIMLAVVVAAFPTMIVGIDFVVENVAGPISSAMQYMVYSTFTVTQSSHVVGPLYLAAMVIAVGAVPILTLLYLYSLPLYLMDSLPQLLSLNLSVGGANNHLGEMSSMMKMSDSLNGLKKGVQAPKSEEGPEKDSGGDGGGGGGDGGGGDGGEGEATEKSSKNSSHNSSGDKAKHYDAKT